MPEQVVEGLMTEFQLAQLADYEEASATWRLIQRFREANAALGDEPFVLTIKDCSSSGWRVECHYLHHDGDMQLGAHASPCLLFAVRGAISEAMESIPWALNGTKGFTLDEPPLVDPFAGDGYPAWPRPTPGERPCLSCGWPSVPTGLRGEGVLVFVDWVCSNLSCGFRRQSPASDDECRAYAEWKEACSRWHAETEYRERESERIYQEGFEGNERG